VRIYSESQPKLAAWAEEIQPMTKQLFTLTTNAAIAFKARFYPDFDL
jgi:hypothetical protein